VKERKLSYDSVKELDPVRFKDLDYTMNLIFNHDEDANLAHNHSLKLLQASHVTSDTPTNQQALQMLSQSKLARAIAPQRAAEEQEDPSRYKRYYNIKYRSSPRLTGKKRKNYYEHPTKNFDKLISLIKAESEEGSNDEEGSSAGEEQQIAAIVDNRPGKRPIKKTAKIIESYN
jgi:hypothetical protein